MSTSSHCDNVILTRYLLIQLVNQFINWVDVSNAFARLTRAATKGATYPKPMIARGWHHGAKYAIELGGGGSPETPFWRQGAKYALEWGEDPPKPPRLRLGGQVCPRMGGGSPPNPPLNAAACNPKNWHFPVCTKLWPLAKFFYISTYPNHIGTMQCHTWPQHTLKISGC